MGRSPDGGILYYPSATGGLFLKGGLGVGGYDLRLASNFSITPFFNGFYVFPAPLELGGSQTGTDVTQSLLQLGLAVTFH